MLDDSTSLPRSLDLRSDMHRWLESGQLPSAQSFIRHGYSRFDPTILRHHPLSRASGAARVDYVLEFGFSIPCREAVSAVASLFPLVEIGAGTGYWSKAIAKAGADIIATDACRTGLKSGYGFTVGKHFATEHLDAEAAVRAYLNRNVFVSWPCYAVPWATAAAKALAPGRFFAIVGEPQGGCTGTDCLFDYFDEAFEEVREVRIPQWYGIADYLAIYRKRP